MTLFGPPVVFCTPNVADTKQPLLLVVQGVDVRLDGSDVDADVWDKYRDVMKRVAADPVGQTLVFEKIMTLFFQHVLGARPETLDNKRRATPKAPRAWCTDGVASSSTAPGIFGPVLAFRGEIEAQGRGSLHPHVLVWLVTMAQTMLVNFLRRDPSSMRPRLAVWMKQVVRSVQSTCQASVRRAPQRFGRDDEVLAHLPFSKTEQALSRYDGGSEVDAMMQDLGADAPDPTTITDEVKSQWSRPHLTLRDKQGVELDAAAPPPPPQSVFSRPINKFAVGRCPVYRRHKCLTCVEHEEPMPALASSSDATDAASVWEKLFCGDVRDLANEILVHVCSDSCFKYSGTKVERICRHGFYYIVNLQEWEWKRRRRGKPLRNGIFVVKQQKHGMQGRLLLFQEHPYECVSNYAAAASMRCNFDTQDLRRVLSEKHWLDTSDDMPHIGFQPEHGYMSTYEWDGDEYVLRRGSAHPTCSQRYTAGATRKVRLTGEGYSSIASAEVRLTKR